jgi:hypothetical protein
MPVKKDSSPGPNGSAQKFGLMDDVPTEPLELLGSEDHMASDNPANLTSAR